jgi:hypothetical protein
MKKWIGAHIHETETHLREDTHVKKAIIDSTGASGNTGDVLVTTGNTVTWVNASVASSTYTFSYTSAQALETWVINHNLNRNPSVTVTDLSGNWVIPDVFYNSADQITLTFNGATAGYAYLN